jgi:DNA ligase-1
MTNFVDIIVAAESAGGSGTKKIISAALMGADAIAQRCIHEALNPYRVFGVRKYDAPSKAGESSVAAYDALFSLLDKLCTRELTGNAARDAVTAVLEFFTAADQPYIARIFDKDLKSGFSAETFNKIHSSNKIPTFDVMLADKCDAPEDFETAITFPCQADFKYDGERTIAIVKKNEITYYSRSGKEATHVAGLFDAELYRIRDLLGHDFVLDGERYASNFTETMNAKKEGNDAAKAALKFRAFFLMPLSDWIVQSTKITMRHNRCYLAEVLQQVEASKIVLSEGREVTDYADMMQFCNEAIDDHAVEGLILKDWEAVYTWDRTFAWTKVKRFFDVDCRIVGFYAGRPKSRLASTLGGISVVGFTESGERVEANVGSGFSDEQRQEIWENQEAWLGRTVVIKYQEISRSKGKDVASLRFPTYERWRDDKAVEI